MFSFHHHFTNYFCNSFFYPYDGLLVPRKVYFTGIPRPYLPPLFTLLPVTSQLMVQFGNDKN